MELWKTMEGYDGTFSISNTKKIHRAEYLTESDCRGVKVQARVPEETFSNMKEITTQYKNENVYFNFFNEERNYFTAEELCEGQEYLKEQYRKKVAEPKVDMQKEAEKYIEQSEEIRKLEETFERSGIESLPGEEWKTIPAYKSFLVSTEGRVKSKAYVNRDNVQCPERIIYPMEREGKKGAYFLLYNLKTRTTDCVFGAKLVADAFLENPNDLFLVHHKDGNPMNIHVENLEWYDDSSSTYYEQKETKSIFKSLADVCRTFKMSKEKVKNCLANGKPLKEGVTIEERIREVSTMVVEKSLPVETKKVIIKKNKSVSNPIPCSKGIAPVTKFTSLPKEIKSITNTTTTVAEEWRKPDRCLYHEVSNKGNVNKLPHFLSYGHHVEKEPEKLYEKNGLIYVKVVDVYGKPIEIPVERLVAETFKLSNPNNYYLIEHKDGDYTNNALNNLRWIEDTEGTLLFCHETKEISSLSETAEVLDVTEKDVYDAIMTFESIGNFSFSITTEKPVQKEVEKELEVFEPVAEVTEKPIETIKEEVPAEQDLLYGITKKSGEEWKVIPYFENYSVSNKGRVVRHAYMDSDKIVPATFLKNEKAAYYSGHFVTLVNEHVKVFRAVDSLVAEAFVENVNHDLWITHLNGQLYDCNAENLMYCEPDKKYDTVKILPYGYVCAGHMRATVETKLSQEEVLEGLKSGHELKGFRFVYLEYMKTNAPIKETKKAAKKYPQEELAKIENKLIKQLEKEVEKADEIEEPVEVNLSKYEQIKNGSEWKQVYPENKAIIGEYFANTQGDICYYVDGVQQIVNHHPDTSGRDMINIRGYKVVPRSRIVADLFLENPYEYEYVKYKKGNTDDSVENLYWAKTKREQWEDNILYEEQKKAVEVVEETTVDTVTEEELQEIEKVETELKNLDIVKALGDLIPKAPKIGSDDMKLELTTIYQAAKIQKEQCHYLTDDEYAEYQKLKKAKETLKVFLD